MKENSQLNIIDIILLIFIILVLPILTLILPFLLNSSKKQRYPVKDLIKKEMIIENLLFPVNFSHLKKKIHNIWALIFHIAIAIVSKNQRSRTKHQQKILVLRRKRNLQPNFMYLHNTLWALLFTNQKNNKILPE